MCKIYNILQVLVSSCKSKNTMCLRIVKTNYIHMQIYLLSAGIETTSPFKKKY